MTLARRMIAWSGLAARGSGSDSTLNEATELEMPREMLQGEVPRNYKQLLAVQTLAREAFDFRRHDSAISGSN